MIGEKILLAFMFSGIPWFLAAWIKGADYQSEPTATNQRYFAMAILGPLTVLAYCIIGPIWAIRTLLPAKSKLPKARSITLGSTTLEVE